jgi:hypothetical protein
MLRHILAGTILFAVCMVNAQTINLRGKISNGSGAAVSGAVVTLVGQNLKDTTRADGMYEIKQTTDVIVYQELQPEHKNFIVEKGALVFSLPEATPLKIELFDVKGNLLKREAMSNVPKGFYRFGIAQNVRAAKVLIIRVVIGNDAKTFRYLPLKNGSYVINQITSNAAPAQENRLMKISAIDDTLKITAEGYKEKKQAIVSYDQEMNILLESDVTSPDTGRSLGCGKPLGAINKSGQYTIRSANANRTFRVRFPSNYDNTNPYRLIFGMHCMGASSADIDGKNARGDGAYDYYRLGPLATNTIFVAPEGNSGGTWGGQEHHTFFEDVLKCLKDTLCIDTTRVFSVGFSFGAMFTYSLSLNHQDQLRAVVCYAPYNGVIWLPTNTHKPLAYMQTTGMSDPTCPWERGGQGGKYCAITHAQDNGCTDPTDIPTSNGQYKVHDYKGCDEGYPVKVVTWGGAHTAGESWMPQMTWDFIKQF